MLIFEFSYYFGFNTHSVVLDLIYLDFNLEDTNLRVAVFFLVSNMLEKRYSDFLALALLTGVGVIGYLGLLLLNPSGVENIAASRMF